MLDPLLTLAGYDDAVAGIACGEVVAAVTHGGGGQWPAHVRACLEDEGWRLDGQALGAMLKLVWYIPQSAP